MQKGQAAIEFIFLILIVVVYIVTVTMPLVKDGQNALMDVENISRTNNETQKISNTINDIAIQGIGSRQTIIIFSPEQSTIRCNSTSINYEVTLKQQPYPIQCNLGTCSKSFSIPTGFTLECGLQIINGPAKLKLVIEKTAANKIKLLQGS